MKKYNTILAVILAISLASCSAPGMFSTAKSAAAQSTAAMSAGENSSFIADTNESAYVKEAAEGSGTAMPANSADKSTGGTALSDISADSQRKIIYSAYIDLEALDFEKTISDVLKCLEQSGGYVSSENINGGTDSTYRHANYELRVPQKNYKSFLTLLSGTGNIVSQTQNTQDVTSSYIDVEARLKSLRMQEERLLDMMSKAGELETLLAIQNQLTEVTYNIESYTSQKNTYDNLIDYSTVNLNVTLVQRITESKDTFWQRISSAFSESWNDFASFLQNSAVFVVYALPSILIIALIIGAGIIIAKRSIKKKRLSGTAKKNAGIEGGEVKKQSSDEA